MPKFEVEATLTKRYKIAIDAENASAAIDKLDGWISDDFEGYQIAAEWQFEASPEVEYLED